jgi:prepilin-type N-terminal cleavage/methylation domain-containing protein
MKTTTLRPLPRRRRAFTLVELITSLLILSMLGAAVCGLVIAATNTDRYLRLQTDTESKIELAAHRLAANERAAMSTTPPSVTTLANGQSSLTLTVPDVANSTTRTVTYYCTGASAPYTLVEVDPRYNAGAPSLLVPNVTSFSVTIATSPTTLISNDVRSSVANLPQVRRHFQVQARDF